MTGESWPVIKFNKVDFPVPLSPTMAILCAEIRLRLHGLKRKMADIDLPRVHVDTEAETVVQEVLLLSRV